MPDYSVINILCSELDISISELLNGEEAKSIQISNTDKSENKKEFFGGVFVLINFILCTFFSFEHLIFPFEQTIGKVMGIWVLFICSITVYPIFKLSVKSDDYSLIAGLNMEKNIDKKLAAKILRLISVWSSLSAMIYSFLYLIMPFVKGSAAQSLYGGILTVGYIVGLAFVILIENRKYTKGRND